MVVKILKQFQSLLFLLWRRLFVAWAKVQLRPLYFVRQSLVLLFSLLKDTHQYLSRYYRRVCARQQTLELRVLLAERYQIVSSYLAQPDTCPEEYKWLLEPSCRGIALADGPRLPKRSTRKLHRRKAHRQ